MRTSLWIILFLCFTAGCKSKNAIPDSVLPPKKMQLILWDMMRADQFLSDYVLNKDTSIKKNPESLKYYQQIFAIHKVSKEQFQHSFSFYQSHPVLLKAIMDSLSTPVIETPKQPAKPDTVSPIEVQDTLLKKKGKKPIVPA